MDKEKIILILEKIPKNILIYCAEQLMNKRKNHLKTELEKLIKKLNDASLEDIDSVMKRIKEIKEQIKNTGCCVSKNSDTLIIPGAKYYVVGDTRFFKIEVKGKEYIDLHAILKNNTLSGLDSILEYLGDYVTDREAIVYIEDEYSEEHQGYIFTEAYNEIKNQKLLRIRELVEGLTNTGSKSDCITRSKVPLRDYQIKAIRFINNPSQKSLLVVHGTGMGKTLTALTATQCYLDANPKDKVVVVSPASLVGNFSKEMTKYGGRLSEHYNFYSFTKFTSLNRSVNKTPFDVYYGDEIDAFVDLHRDENGYETSDEIRYMMSKHFNEEVKNSTDFEEYKKRANEINFKDSYDCRNTMVIIDEAHNLRNMGSRYDAIFKCVAQSKKLLLLTATPFVNGLHDFVPLINLLYRDENIIKRGSKIPATLKTRDKFLKSLNVIFDYLKGKVTFLNEKNSEFFPVVKMHKKEIDMTPEFFKKYETALISDRTYGDAPEVFFNGFRRAVNSVGAEEYINQKLDIITDLINKGNQTLIFTNWIEAGVLVLEQTFGENDIPYAIISGEILASTRIEIVEQFNNKKFQVLIITLAGSEGLDLKEVRDVIILDPVWNPAVMEQIIGRAVRFRSHMKLPLSERRVDVYNLILKTPKDAIIPSGDEILYSIIDEKREQLGEVNKMLKNASI